MQFLIGGFPARAAAPRLSWSALFGGPPLHDTNSVAYLRSQSPSRPHGCQPPPGPGYPGRAGTTRPTGGNPPGHDPVIRQLTQPTGCHMVATNRLLLSRGCQGNTTMKTPPVVTPQEWEAARQQLLVNEKEVTRARDALAAERRRMPWLAVEKDYTFDGPEGQA